MSFTIKKVIANNLEFSYVEFGEGQPVICLHGFPDSAEGFFELAQNLAEQGYKVFVPWMRGYYPTELGEQQGYAVDVLADDVVALIDQLAAGKAIVIGHDWGAFAAYMAAIKQPKKISKLVIMSVPHMGHAEMSLKQLLSSWYVMFFQLPWLPENQIRKRHFALIDFLYKSWSPNWPFSKQHSQAVKNALYDKSHINAALGYYRAMGRISKDLYQLMKSPVEVPTLILAGESDGSIDIKHFLNKQKVAQSYLNLYKIVCYPNLGHFPHREAPEKTSNDILEFFQS